jgi:hypothetical protein
LEVLSNRCLFHWSRRVYLQSPPTAIFDQAARLRYGDHGDGGIVSVSSTRIRRDRACRDILCWTSWDKLRSDQRTWAPWTLVCRRSDYVVRSQWSISPVCFPRRQATPLVAVHDRHDALHRRRRVGRVSLVCYRDDWHLAPSLVRVGNDNSPRSASIRSIRVHPRPIFTASAPAPARRRRTAFAAPPARRASGR